MFTRQFEKLAALVLVSLLALSLAGAAEAATPGQRNALATAESYLSLQAFSKLGLIDQLKFERYSDADARWAANHVKVSWGRQAVKAARSYLSIQSFSRGGLIDQLLFEKFTRRQAVYGANQAYG